MVMYQILGGIVGLLIVMLLYATHRLNEWQNWCDINFPFMSDNEVRKFCEDKIK